MAEENTNRRKGVKRLAGVKEEEEATKRSSQNIAQMENQPSTSCGISNSSVGVLNSGPGTVITGLINNTYETSRPKPTENLQGICVQLEDAVVSFRGRHAELKRIEEAFKKPRKHQYKLIAICGYGGLGKTQIAKRFAQINKKTFENIVWINAERQDTMESSFEVLQNDLKNLNFGCSTLQDVYKYLNNNKCLFIFDNAENMQSILNFLPKQSNSSCFLITSQQKRWAPYEPILLNTLDPESAKNIIDTVFKTNNTQIPDDLIKILLEKYEHIPLILQITSSLILQRIFDCKDIKEEYDLAKIVQEICSDDKVIEQDFPEFSSDSYRNSVLKAVSQSLNRVFSVNDDISNLAEDILGVSAYLDVNEIYKFQVLDLLDCDTELFNKSLALLVRLSLFQISVSELGDERILLHRTVQQCIRWSHKKTENDKHFEQTLRRLLIHDSLPSWHKIMIFKCGEEYLKTICSFYNKNKCKNFFENISKFATPKVFHYLLEKTELIRNPEFLCHVYYLEKRKDINLIGILKDYNVNLDVENDKGLTAIYFACIRDKDFYSLWCIKPAIDTLIKNGANINFRNTVGNTVLHNLCEFGLEDINSKNYSVDVCLFKYCTLSIVCGANVNVLNNKNETASDIANKYKLRLTEKLLNLAIDNHIIIAVAKCEDLETFLDLVVANRCNVNVQDSQGCTVLHIICNSEAKTLLHAIHRLINSNADVTIRNNNGETAEDICRKKAGSTKIADFLNAFVSISNINNTHSDVLNKFMKLDINIADEDGNTLLHTICSLEENEEDLIKYAVRLVMGNGANCEMKNNKGEMAEDIACRRNHPLLVHILRIIRRNRRFRNSELLEMIVEEAIRYHKVHLLKFILLLDGYYSSWYIFERSHRLNNIFAFCKSTPDVISDEAINEMVKYFRFTDFDKPVAKKRQFDALSGLSNPVICHPRILK